MRPGVLCIATVLLAACGSTPPPPPVTRPAAPPPDETPMRALTHRECESLAQWIIDVCSNRAPLRSARIDGWCGDVENHTTSEDESWITDCVKHVKAMDGECFRSTRSLTNLMACDSNVA